MELAPWQVIHMRLLGKHKYLPYGTAKIDAARRIWRQLTLYKDAMLLYRLVRAPERKAFYVDVQGIKAADVPPFMKEYISKIRHNPVVDVSNSNKDLPSTLAAVPLLLSIIMMLIGDLLVVTVVENLPESSEVPFVTLKRFFSSARGLVIFI